MMSKTRIANAVRWTLFAGASFAVASPVMAADDGADLERIEVTGSRIKRTDMESASPLVVISSEDIASQGFNSTQDVLDSLTQNSGGSLTQQESFGFTPAASGVNLRGAGLGRTLTLIDGKRVAKYPFAAGGTQNFTDTSNIPVGAIERIEILTTGASAIYGSDAMGGVINIILKKNVEDTIINAYVSDTDHGGRATNKISLVTGSSDDNSSMLLFVEHEKRDRLKASDRWSLGSDLAWDHRAGSYSGYGASLWESKVTSATGRDQFVATSDNCTDLGFIESNGVCSYNRAGDRQLLPDQERTSLMVKFTNELSDNHQLFGRVDYTHATVEQRIEAMAIGDDFLFNVSGNDVTLSSKARPELSKTYDKATAFGGDFAGQGDGTYYYRRRAAEFGPRAGDFTTDNFSAVFGLQGYLTDDIGYETSWSLSRQRIDKEESGYATINGYFDYLNSCVNGCSQLDAISQDQLDMASYQPYQKGQSTLVSWTFGINGDLFELDAGTVQYAAGIEMNREWFYDRSDVFSQRGEILTTGGSSGQGSRKQYAGYAELSIPVVDKLTATLAGRYDYYDDASDVGGAFSPQVALEYRPVNELLLRALWAKTFRAPDMQRLFGEPTTAYANITDFQQCALDGVDSVACAKDPSNTISANVIAGANPDLEEEKGENWNLGLVYNPGNFDVSVDWWHVEIDNIVTALGASYVMQKHDKYANMIDRDAVTGEVTINTQAINLSNRTLEGVDMAVGYTLDTAAAGTFKFRLEGSYQSKWEEQLDASSPVESSFYEGGIPRWRANFTTKWMPTDDLAITAMVKYIADHKGAYASEFFGKATDFDTRVDAHTEVNTNIAYNLTDNVKVAAGVNNLFDAKPEVDNTYKQWPFFDSGYYNPIGREFYASAELRF